MHFIEEIVSDTDSIADDSSDEDYIAAEDSDFESDVEKNCNQKTSIEMSYKFVLVDVEKLLQLFSTCRCCNGNAMPILQFKEAFFQVTQKSTECSEKFIWTSSDYLSSTPAVNLLVSAAILFSGSSPSKCLRLFKSLDCPAVCYRTYLRHQKNFLFPKTEQRLLLDEILSRDDRSVKLGGDGRCDSPGFCAKFGAYTISPPMDLDTGKVVAIQIVESNEVGSSNAMEKEGLLRILDFLVYPRKLMPFAKQKECKTIGEWKKSIVNHLYWCALSSHEHNHLILPKWLSLINHLHNIHEGHDDPVFPRCLHDPISERRRLVKWLQPHSKMSEKLTEIVSNHFIKKDVQMMSTHFQTFRNDKVGITCRIYLAALHNNENALREQATTKDGKMCYSTTFPKCKKGGSSIKRIYKKPTYSY
uniref:THAP-type domain-containing protein n=1 Tax=Strigamia maritima TaxID=126957 RepID=T1J2D3_STRMM